MSRNFSFSDRNVVWYILVVLILIPPVSSIIFPENFNNRSLVSALAAVIFSILIIYYLVFKGTPLKLSHNQKYGFPKPKERFSPTVKSPSKLNKKTILKGECSLCHENTIFGFTCSYCGLYFCPEHRLPEKHNCLDLRK